MANVIKIKHSNVIGNVPAPGSLAQGEIAINTVDKKLFWFDGVAIQTFILSDQNSFSNALIFG